MAEFRQEPFFSSSSHRKGQDTGHRSEWGWGGGRPGCQGGVHRRGKANGAHWTVQTGLRAARIITIAQAASADERQRAHSQPR